MLWACLLLPSLPLDVFTRALPPGDAERPLAVTTGGRAPRIVRANAAAHAAGVRPRQLVSAALAFEPDLALRERDPAAESAALQAVATALTRWTPTVAIAAPDAVLAEIGPCLRLFGGLPSLAAALARSARELGYAVRLAVAPTPGASLLFARDGDDAGAGDEAAVGAWTPGPAIPATGEIEPVRVVTDASALDAALAAMPLSLLDADPEAIATLSSTGIATIGQASALPRAALARRTGPGFVDCLDRVRGRVPDVRVPFVPPPRYRGKIDLQAAVDNVEALGFALNRLVVEMTGWLRGRGLGIVEMSLALAHDRAAGAKTGVPATTASFALAAPTRDPAHLGAVLRERLARVALAAPVETIALRSVLTAPLAGRNPGLLPGDDAAPGVPLIDRLRARLGDDAVTLVAVHGEHRPELAWRDTRRGDGTPARSEGSAREPRRPPEDAGTPVGPRPLWLLAEPEPLGHLLEAQPWVLRDGPERIESGWWDGHDVRRDYFVAENPRGETVWIYRDHRYGVDDGEWFMHGVFA